MAMDGIVTVMLDPSILPWTLTMDSPDTKVTYEPAGMGLAAVNITEAPTAGGEHLVVELGVGFGGPPGPDFPGPHRRTVSEGEPQFGSSQVQVEASTVRLGKAVKGNGGLLAGHETMKAAARV